MQSILKVFRNFADVILLSAFLSLYGLTQCCVITVRTLQRFDKCQSHIRKRKRSTIPSSTSYIQKLKVTREDSDAALLDVEKKPTNE